jgi:UrcA family protein
MILLGVLATSAGQISQAAQTDVGVLSQKVEYGDLDLSQMKGTKALYGRLLGAAETVCAPLEGQGVSRIPRYKACVRSAVAAAVTQVNKPLLTQYFDSKHGGRAAGSVQVAMGR